MKKVRYFISDKVIEIISTDTGRKNADIPIRKDGEKFNVRGSIKMIHIPVSENSRREFERAIKTVTKLSCVSVALSVPDCKTGKISVQNSFRTMMEEIISAVGRGERFRKISVILPENCFNICEKIATELLESITKKTFRNPYPAADVIIKKSRGVVLIYRRNFPQGWAIPGGFINFGESAENAAMREAKEETGLKIKNLKLFGVFSKPGRDPRFHTISIVFTADGEGEICPGDDASKAKIFHRNALPENIAFDHREILERFFDRNLIRSNKL